MSILDFGCPPTLVGLHQRTVPNRVVQILSIYLQIGVGPEHLISLEFSIEPQPANGIIGHLQLGNKSRIFLLSLFILLSLLQYIY